MGAAMEKNSLKRKNIVFWFTTSLIFIVLFTIVNILLYRRKYYDERIINISYLIICVALLINFINSYLISKKTILLNLSLGKTRKEVFHNYLCSIIYTILIILGIYIIQSTITYYIWNKVIMFDINYIYQFTVVIFLTLGIGFIGFILGVFKVKDIFVVLIVAGLVVLYCLNNIFVLTAVDNTIQIIICSLLLIINVLLFIITKKIIMSLKIR